MNIVPRLVAAAALAGLLVALPSAAGAFTGAPSATGDFLAGQQAMEELRTPDAASFLRDAATEQWANPVVVDRSFLAFAADGQIENAATTARHALEIDPTNQMARLILASQALKERRYRAAAGYLDKMGSDTFEGVAGSILRAWALIGDGRADEALKGLDEVGKGGLGEFLVLHRALMADVAGRSDEALELASEAHEENPYTAEVVEAYSRMLGNAGRFDEALDVLGQFEAQGLSHPVITEVKTALEHKQRPGLFVQDVQAGAAEMFYSVGFGFARDGTMSVSMVLMRLAAYLDPHNGTYPLLVAQLYDSAGQHTLANAVYEAIPAASPLKPVASVRMAGNLDALGDRPQAIRRLSNMAATNPTDIDAVSLLGDLLRSDKQYQAAADAYTKALAVSGGNTASDWRFYYLRGIAYERSEQWALAEQDFLKALDLNPTQPSVLNYLGYSWVDKGQNLDRALAMIQKAIAGSPDDGYIIDSLGWAYYRLGRYDDAVTQLLQAVTLRPNDAEINDHLGDAYWRVGRKLEARFQWNIASSVDTEGNVKARVAPKLKGGLDAAPTGSDAAPRTDEPGDQAQAD